MALAACQPDFRPPSSEGSQGINVTRISTTAVDPTASAQEGAPGICREWKLTAEQAENFFALSKEIDGRTFVHEYDTAPCKITGTVKALGHTWDFTINGAAKAMWKSGDEIRYLGCDAPACDPLVLWPFIGMDP